MKKGFTLVELLVVVAILGILAAVGIVSFGGFMGSAKENVSKSNFDAVVKYIYLEVSKCQFGAEKIMSDYLVCPPTTFGPGIKSQIIKSLRVGNNIFKNPYNNDLAVNSGNIHNEDEYVGYIGITSTGNPKSYIKVKTCYKLPCSNTNNHIETLIISDMISQ